MAQLAARKYATALYELALDNNMEGLLEEANNVLGFLKNEPNFLDTLLHPQVTVEQKIDIIEKSFQGFSATMLGFLHTVIRKGRENELVAMFEDFISMVEEHKGILNAEVVSAAPLSDDHIAKIKSQLAQKTGKEVNLSVREDASLIGGVCIKAGGYVFDRTVKTQLENMRLSLLG